MFTHPYLASELVYERQCDMLAQADQQRLVRQLRDLARASRRAAQVKRRMTHSRKRSRPAVLSS
jgi:hypothetical protein